jgi:hypothetical protein
MKRHSAGRLDSRERAHGRENATAQWVERFQVNINEFQLSGLPLPTYWKVSPSPGGHRGSDENGTIAVHLKAGYEGWRFARGASRSFRSCWCEPGNLAPKRAQAPAAVSIPKLQNVANARAVFWRGPEPRAASARNKPAGHSRAGSPWG